MVVFSAEGGVSKNCPSVASWSVKVERAVKSTCSIVLVGFLVMVGAVGTSSSTGLETTVRVIARLISANSSAVHILRMLYLSSFCL
ncbi:unnamed protein product [Coffea canephora]|uniref:DH200=94 genomic scaffold, scaffold_425 n=1 Tax=Coffea canephora TaxID=49390 RepID=A0A068VER5_COFCA|nr:unnamed protein product [Coffea canephora]